MRFITTLFLLQLWMDEQLPLVTTILPVNKVFKYSCVPPRSQVHSCTKAVPNSQLSQDSKNPQFVQDCGSAMDTDTPAVKLELSGILQHNAANSSSVIPCNQIRDRIGVPHSSDRRFLSWGLRYLFDFAFDSSVLF